ncbi:MAG: tRNA (adenosine(37)-N6)-threonylcarbamoyltransferase complex dimerization subunit type 1 TsaB [Desulforudis sp.]|jgi:tRNA threonylcarbamoyladenosine biosynthesis protein TsaB|nr:tRNA (adenosine(37)-N6)-threonylcarbamoyltransferase complex dimerization subunit type 1 TsaB [Clostridia bacterium]MDQ7791325.1 tRNA (adenosine(37)-N6)-threonylcarbamoyltransferase complex dimerization subunit type 1 TsaB [Clostridia bacterium]RJX19251.1 MAG: tRNA (adenosine(37)-N6)-threonylcarbamoyltransferase complex dimerization subunit type 1 TsaB [Desulforudis sp.]
MLVFGIETSGPVCSVGLVDRDTVLAERTVWGQKIHSVRLIPLIDGVLRDAGKQPVNLEGIAVSSGPGSFTGLRIGLTTAKSLAHALDLPVVGVPSLDVLAYPVRETAGLVCAIVPARKGEVYAGVYGPGHPEPRCLHGPVALETGALVEMACRLDEPILFLGEAVSSCRELLEKELGTRARFSPVSLQPRGAVVAEMGRVRLVDGRGTTAFTLQPEYIRPPAAELVWQARNER